MNEASGGPTEHAVYINIASDSLKGLLDFFIIATD